MQYIYFLTIDKVLLGVPPLKQDLITVRNDICTKFNLDVIRPYQVQSFEFKDKGRLHGKYLHYHCLLESSAKYIKYSDIKFKGWSIKLEKLNTFLDVVRTAGYIYKQITISNLCKGVD